MKIINVEQGSHEWDNIRLWKITWTKLKQVMMKNNLWLIDELIAEKLTAENKEITTSKAMDRWTDEEPYARKAYEEFTWVKVDEVWFCLSDEFDFVWLSPDWLIKQDWKYAKWVEIKCPNSAKHIEYIRINRIPNEYKYQVYHYFIVNEEMEELDFVSYDKRVLAKPLNIVNIKREDILQELEETKKDLIKFKEKLDKYYTAIFF